LLTAGFPALPSRRIRDAIFPLPLFRCASSSPSLVLFGATFTRIAEVPQVRAASPALRDWMSFQAGEGRFACWSKERERSFSRMKLE